MSGFRLAPFLLLAQAASTLAMFGVIWFVQVVHYPLFQRVGAQHFSAYSASHGNRTTVVVAPLMLLELATAATLLFPALRATAVHTGEAWAGAFLVGVLWLSTALWQVPLHDRLRASYTASTAQRLVVSNWVRTAAWTLRAALVLLWLYRGMRPA